MSAWVVAVELEDHDDPSNDASLIFGPFRSAERAAAVATQIGRRCGLTPNTWGGWSGTDGNDRFVLVRPRRAYQPTIPRLEDLAKTIRELIERKETANDDPE